MGAITDFDAWLDSTEYNFEEIYSLYQSVSKTEDWSLFSTTEKQTSNGVQFFVKSDCCEDLLLLASEKARIAFLKHLEAKYCGELDMESWYGYNYANSKND